MALFKHGVRRFTEDVDVLIRKSDLKLVHEKLEGRGYLPLHRHSKHLRDTESKVRIEFLTSGDFPGDRLAKPIAFPDPPAVAPNFDANSYVNPGTLVEMKPASGMTGMGRLKELGDVLELIRLLNLPVDFAERLHPYVRQKYQELWQQARRRFVALWHPRDLGDEERQSAIDAMRQDGVTLEPRGVDEMLLVTSDPDVAKKYDMLDEAEFWAE
jgi:hypothetical protein